MSKDANLEGKRHAGEILGDFPEALLQRVVVGATARRHDDRGAHELADSLRTEVLTADGRRSETSTRSDLGKLVTSLNITRGFLRHKRA